MPVDERVGVQPSRNKLMRLLVFVLSASLLTLGLTATAVSSAYARDTHTFRVNEEFGFCWTRPATEKGVLQLKWGSTWRTVDRFKPSDFVRDDGCARGSPYFLAFDYVGQPHKTDQMRIRIKGWTVNGTTAWEFNVRWKGCRRCNGGGGGSSTPPGGGGGGDTAAQKCRRFYNELAMEALGRNDLVDYYYYRNMASQC